MIQLYPSFRVEGIELDEVVDTMTNFKEFIAPLVENKDQYPLPTISFNLTKWYKPQGSDNYLCITVGVNLDNVDNYYLRVVDGYYNEDSEDNEGLDSIYEGDGFVDIKKDIHSIQFAIEDIKTGTIPLWNRVNSIDYAKYSYIKPDDVDNDCD